MHHHGYHQQGLHPGGFVNARCAVHMYSSLTPSIHGCDYLQAQVCLSTGRSLKPPASLQPSSCCQLSVRCASTLFFCDDVFLLWNLVCSQTMGAVWMSTCKISSSYSWLLRMVRRLLCESLCVSTHVGVGCVFAGRSSVSTGPLSM